MKRQDGKIKLFLVRNTLFDGPRIPFYHTIKEISCGVRLTTHPYVFSTLSWVLLQTTIIRWRKKEMCEVSDNLKHIPGNFVIRPALISRTSSQQQFRDVGWLKMECASPLRNTSAAADQQCHAAVPDFPCHWRFRFRQQAPSRIQRRSPGTTTARSIFSARR